MRRWLEITMIAVGAAAFLLLYADARAQVPCWYAYVTPETYTIQCNNGYWSTYRADGTQITGNGMIDPNATAQGSTIQINPGTGGPTGLVSPPAQLPLDAPHQAPAWGLQPLQTR